MNTHKIKASTVPIVPVPVAPEKPTPPCVCQDYNPLECMARRHSAARTLVSLCGDGAGCSCSCHKTPGGAHISHIVWHRRRDALQPRTQLDKSRPVNWLSDEDEE
jgi:hypothetical protein